MKEYKATVTQEIINESDILHAKNCIGVNTLKTIFPENEIVWGDSFGWVKIDNEVTVFKSIDNEGNRVSMMHIKDVTEVVFIELFKV